MNNTTEPLLPEQGLIYIEPFQLEEIAWFSVALLPLTLLLLIPFLWGTFYMGNKLCKKLIKCSKKVNCATEIEWTERNLKCGDCVGSCQCTQMGKMVAD